MKTIWKFRIETVDEQVILMPSGADILCVQVQDGIPCLWALVDPDSTATQRVRIFTHGTGHHVLNSNKKKYIGTYQLRDGALVFHVFQEI